MKILLHLCCAPCGPHVIQLLQKEFAVVVYFYAPNIHPEEEYNIRLKEIKNYCRKIKTPLIVGEYDTKRWYELTAGYEHEPEKGRRCDICHKMRMEKTADYAANQGFDYFTTAMSVSPHKDAAVINRIGKELAEKYKVKFYEADFKKQDGFKKSVELSRQHGFYRQNYCGCVHSFRIL